MTPGSDNQAALYRRPWRFQPVATDFDGKVPGDRRSERKREHVVEIERVVEVPVDRIVERVVQQPETGWDDETDPKVLFFDSSTGETMEGTAACTSRILDLIHTVDEPKDWSALHLFADDALCATHIFLEAGKSKEATINCNSFVCLPLPSY